MCIRGILDIPVSMLTWRCTKSVTSRYGKCHNVREKIGGVVSYSVTPTRRVLSRKTLSPTLNDAQNECLSNKNQSYNLKECFDDFVRGVR